MSANIPKIPSDLRTKHHELEGVKDSPPKRIKRIGDPEQEKMNHIARETFCTSGEPYTSEAKPLSQEITLFQKEKTRKMDDLHPAKKNKQESEESLLPEPVFKVSLEDNQVDTIEECEIPDSDPNSSGAQFVDIPLILSKEGNFDPQTPGFTIEGNRDDEMTFKIVYQASTTKSSHSFRITLPYVIRTRSNEEKPFEIIKSTFELSAASKLPLHAWKKFKASQLQDLLKEIKKLTLTTFSTGHNKIFNDLNTLVINLLSAS